MVNGNLKEKSALTLPCEELETVCSTNDAPVNKLLQNNYFIAKATYQSRLPSKLAFQQSCLDSVNENDLYVQLCQQQPAPEHFQIENINISRLQKLVSRNTKTQNSGQASEQWNKLLLNQHQLQALTSNQKTLFTIVNFFLSGSLSAAQKYESHQLISNMKTGNAVGLPKNISLSSPPSQTPPPLPPLPSLETAPKISRQQQRSRYVLQTK